MLSPITFGSFACFFSGIFFFILFIIQTEVSCITRFDCVTNSEISRNVNVFFLQFLSSEKLSSLICAKCSCTNDSLPFLFYPLQPFEYEKYRLGIKKYQGTLKRKKKVHKFKHQFVQAR